MRAAFGRVALTLLAGLTLTPALAQAPCTPPVPPEVRDKPAKLLAPAKPACAEARPPQLGCTAPEANAYNEAVQAYNAGLSDFQRAANAYVARLNDFVSASADYARCEVETLQ